ncbi:Adenylate cyclase-like protein [Elsinoe fawcettii]|nr:Adenylate cyclase-like protein [Elsinoe fawcettii]
METVRKGSTSGSVAESWRSSETVKGESNRFASLETPPRTKNARKSPLDKDLEISPHTVVTPGARYNVAPWEADDFSTDHRKDLSRLNSGPPVPPKNGHSPTNSTSHSPAGPFKDPTPQYSRANRPSKLPSSVFGAAFNLDDDLGAMSPGFHPMNSGDYLQEERRPSVASSSTVSSTASAGQRLAPQFKKKKLQGFFGEEYATEHGARQGSDGSLPQSMQTAGDGMSLLSRPFGGNDDSRSMRSRTIGGDGASVMSRQGSTSGYRPTSPTGSSKAKGPKPSSEVTPWEFQETDVSTEAVCGVALDVKEVARDRRTNGLQDVPKLPESGTATPNKSKAPGRLHLPGHRHNKSQDEKKSSQDDGRPAGREYDQNGVRASVSSTSTLKPRSSSPTPSMGSIQSRDTTYSTRTASTSQGGSKRSIFSRVTGRHKDGTPTDRSLKTLPSSAGTFTPTSRHPSVVSNVDLSKNNKNRKPTLADLGRPFGSSEKPAPKEKHRLPFKSKKGDSRDDGPRTKDPNGIKTDGNGNVAALWHLDTDMGNMEGIIDLQQLRQPSFVMTPPVGKFDNAEEGFPFGMPEPPNPDAAQAGAWDAPDSWAVKRIPDMPADMNEEEEDGPREKDAGPMFFMRIFRADSTFAVISAGLNTTSSELIQTMAKKTYLQDELDTYQIVMRKRGLSRQLTGFEKPLQIQTALLQMAGYQENDNLSDLGREDHGYLCRFTFLPSKMTGYSSLEKDPGFNKMQRFNHIDLAGRNLVTIPIALYQKASEIITLNLSQNLSLDIPKDFMQGCMNLREVKYTSNEATRIPSSFALAGKLTMVDFSNNRLENLDYSDLDRLQGLISLKLSNNKLDSLPEYLGHYQALRSLNLASNSLSEFPDFLGELSTLVDLDVSFNNISSLPSVGKLTNLERLFATNNKLSGSFPDNFKDLVNLNSLDVRFNAIDSIDVMSQLPKLEHLMVGHNSISAFEGTFSRLKLLFIDHNPVTRFGLASPVPSLSVLNIASAKLAQLPDDLYMKMSGLTKLVLNKNHLVSVSPQVGRLAKLEHLSIAKNVLDSLPPEIGHLQNLRYLDVRENNLNRLPSEIWYARRLEALNVASNVLADFPKPGNPPKDMPGDILGATPTTTPGTLSSSPDFDELGKLEGFQMRRPSYVGGPMPTGQTSPGPSGALRKGSTASALSSGRNPSLTARSSQESNLGTPTPANRKDSTLSGKLAQTFTSSLRTLILADNRLNDEVFDELMLLTELRQLNLSYNEIYDMPPRTIKRWPNLTELYLSGNDLTSLPAEDLEDGSSLRILHLNSNKFQVLPAEIGKIQKLQTLDVASNSLKYNVTNWPYDWNWNYNPQLRYLNLSGNKRLEIRPNANAITRGETKDLTDFSTLTNLRILGLMDVTLTIPSVPDEGPDRRVRTAGSVIGTSIPYGMADTLGRSEHLSTLDMVIPNFQGHEDQTVFGMFDGQALSSGGSRVARYLHEKFRYHLSDELEKLKADRETPIDALRRAYLGLNKELATAATQATDKQEAAPGTIHRASVGGPELGDDDISSGAVATVCYLNGMDLYVSNVGDAQALLISSEGSHRIITQKHDPAEAGERQRIKTAGGFVSRQGKLNDVLEVSRAFGYAQYMPVVTAAPHVSKISLKETDEMILLASRELWDYLTFDFAVDIARSERTDLMRAAQKLRDLAIAFGATSKLMVMMVGVSDLRKRERARFRTHSMSMGPTGMADDYFATARRGKRGRDNVGDSKLARLDQEVEAPTGDVSLVFTDIKNSTMLWETYPIAMRSAIKMHNEVMRRHLRIIGGYEVKTEGDAFMVAFPTVTSALLWCFTIQSQLLEVQWPQEITNSAQGQEVLDADDNVIFRGLSVRMGIHWGRPVCEIDPITKRMDYFGPMVNRAARIESVADGGQITVSSDFIAEIQRLLETHIESDRAGSAGSEETMADDHLNAAIRRELRSLSSQGFEVKDLGLKHLKGLENPEYIYLMYPHSLASRLVVQQQRAEAEAAAAAGTSEGRPQNSRLAIDTESLWKLREVSLRLEMLCSTLETPGVKSMKTTDAALTDRGLKIEDGQVTDPFVVGFVEHQVARIETAITTLVLRNALRPFRPGTMLSSACPISDILGEVLGQLSELQDIKESHPHLLSNQPHPPFHRPQSYASNPRSSVLSGGSGAGANRTSVLSNGGGTRNSVVSNRPASVVRAGNATPGAGQGDRSSVLSGGGGGRPASVLSNGGRPASVVSQRPNSVINIRERQERERQGSVVGLSSAIAGGMGGGVAGPGGRPMSVKGRVGELKGESVEE